VATRSKKRERNPKTDHLYGLNFNNLMLVAGVGFEPTTFRL
jgi:hypothetical protein